MELARHSDLSLHQESVPAPADDLADNDEAIRRWLQATVTYLGFEAEPEYIPYPDVVSFISTAGPALFPLRQGDELGFLALLRGRRRRLSLIGPDHAIHQVSLETVRATLCKKLEAPFLAEINQLLGAAGVPERRQARARALMLSERLNQAHIGCWLFDPSPGSNFWRQLRRAGVPGQLLMFAGAHSIQYFLWILSWGLIGRSVFQGRVDVGWLLAWALILITIIPFRLLVTWLQGLVTVNAGGLLQKRLLYGVLRLRPDEIRHLGAGQLMGRVFESEAVESLALSGGLVGLMALIELVMAGYVLSIGAARSLHLILLFGWLLFTGVLTYRYAQRSSHWTAIRRRLTHDLIERMVGHRTLLAQSSPEQWHDGEDEALARYVTVSSDMDRIGVQLVALVSRGWLVVGLCGLAPAFVAGNSTPAALAISLGGILSVELALRKLSHGLSNLINAAIAWEQVAPIFHAAARPIVAGLPIKPGNNGASPGQPLLDAHDLTYRYYDQGEPVLHNCSLQVKTGERILLEGSSGSGKSTLVALLTGLRESESGLLLLKGLDQRTLGIESWRQRVVSAPQFHENYILSTSFAFNLLMGRRWRPHTGDMEAAEAICYELGLGDLLERMPAGILQMVGETGWQLSHGERSRLYIARALLQDADLIILDESFTALDPDNLRRVVQCVLKRAPTLLVIAHP